MQRPLSVLLTELVEFFDEKQKEFWRGQGDPDGYVHAPGPMKLELYLAYEDDPEAFKAELAKHEFRLMRIPLDDSDSEDYLLAIDNFFLEKEDKPLTLVFYSTKEKMLFVPHLHKLEGIEAKRLVPLAFHSGDWLYHIRHRLLGA